MLSRRAIFALACSVLAQPAWAKAPAHLPEPGYLPPTARALLHADMQRHAAQMSTLMSSALLLDFETLGSVARAIAAEPRIARPTTHDATELNARLPERFFALQDRLHAEASRLAAAADARDAAAASSAYGALEETCMACHASYLAGNPR
jgi:cytochrome c556